MADQELTPTNYLVLICLIGYGAFWLWGKLTEKEETPIRPFIYSPRQVSDIDCWQIGQPIYVGSYDPFQLDADGDGWGCER